MIIGVTLSILLALAGIVAALTISIKINSNQRLSWAAKFIKSILQDFTVTPVLTLLLNYILMTCLVKNPSMNTKLRTFMRALASEEILRLSAGFAQAANLAVRQIVLVKHIICITIDSLYILIQDSTTFFG